jgi:TonB family protein
MRRWSFPLGLLLMGTLSLSASSANQINEPQGQWPCGGHPRLQRDPKGNPVWFGSKELGERAINRVSPKLPTSLRVKGTIIVDVLIDPEGQVKCVRARRGHPILRRATEEAARQWTFKPILVKGEPVAVFGFLAFQFSN